MKMGQNESKLYASHSTHHQPRPGTTAMKMVCSSPQDSLTMYTYISYVQYIYRLIYLNNYIYIYICAHTYNIYDNIYIHYIYNVYFYSTYLLSPRMIECTSQEIASKSPVAVVGTKARDRYDEWSETAKTGMNE